MPAYPDSPVWAFADELDVGKKGTPFSAGTDQVREHFRKFRVILRDKRGGDVAACSAPIIPKPYAFYMSQDGYEFDELALCVKISAEQEHQDDWKSWIVSCDYSTDIPKNGIPNNFGSVGNGQGRQQNPELEPPTLRWDFTDIQKNRPGDLNQDPFLMSNGRPITAPQNVARARLTYTRNERAFSRVVATKYANSTNSLPFAGVGKYMVSMPGPVAEMRQMGKINYFRVTYVFIFHENCDEKRQIPISSGGIRAVAAVDMRIEDWQGYYLDQDTMFWDPVALKLRKILSGMPNNRDGDPVSSPVCLDGNGRVLDLALSPPVYRFFLEKKRVDYNQLLLNGIG
jgi:hypothetical protein